MEPLQLLMYRLSDHWNQSLAPGSFFSLIVFSCLVPFLFSLVSSQVHVALGKLYQLFDERLHRYEYVLVRNSRNDLYRYVSTFLDSKAESMGATKNARIRSPVTDGLVFGLEPGQSISDTFEGVQVEWTFVRSENNKGNNNNSETSEYYRLKLHKKDRDMQRKYLLHIATTVQEREQENKSRSLFTSAGGGGEIFWDCYTFKHPSTFESLAMDSELKARIKSDLDEFVRNQEYYQSVGKPWKRGYLLHGPPGTGKSSMIAAIANYLHFDVYDLDLSGVRSNAELRNLLLQTRNKSVIVIEDIDCCFSTTLEARGVTVEAAKSSSTEGGGEVKDYGGDATQSGEETGVASEGVTLSGMLNFCDGLWSGCGDERVFIFTTNHVENLDPALLRKGRMDLHIHLSYCKFEAMKTLVRNYLKVGVEPEGEHEEVMSEIEMLVEEVNVTPADVAEVLLSSRKDPAAALENVVKLLKEIKDRKAEAQGEAYTYRRKVYKGGPLGPRSSSSAPRKPRGSGRGA